VRYVRVDGMGIIVTTSVADQDALKTYRYLRMAMVLMALLLGVSVLIEWFSTQADGLAGNCALPSISAYYYTPVRSIFVGSLVAIGACLVAVQGSTKPFRFGASNPVARAWNFLMGWVTEDNALNIAGMLAPIVALVPTVQPAREKADRYWNCATVDFESIRPKGNAGASPNITNNISALIIAGIAAVVIALAVAPEKSELKKMAVQAKSGLISAVLVVAAGYAWFFLSRSSFLVSAHFTAAFAMFVAMALAVVDNARKGGRHRGLYSSIALLMAVGGGIIFAAGRTGWRHSILWLEVLEISLFAVFWGRQTGELWNSTARD
jgi:hypothetical protein